MSEEEKFVWIDNKKILITGGTGTIGKALLKKLLTFDIDHVYIFSRDEQKQDNELRYFKQNPKVSFIIGDIRNYDSVNSALRNIDIVFHTAAMKIVRICEYNPYEALITNVIGTENIIRGAIYNKVEKVIFTSSDKAANPTTIMGTGKLYSERLLSQANLIKGNSTIFTSIRFGNVLGSRGCVLDLFKSQIKKSNYVTVTGENMTRFICTIDESVDMLLKSGELANGGEIFIRKMPSVFITDLVKVMIEYLAPKYSKKPTDINIKFIEKQISEKLFEELVTPHEAERTLEFDNYYCILPSVCYNQNTVYNIKNHNKLSNGIASNACAHLGKTEILDFLIKNKLL